MLNFTEYMQLMTRQHAFDCFFSAGAPPSIKNEGVTTHLSEAVLTAEDVRTVAYSIMSDEQQKVFELTFEMNLAVGLPGIGRFRVNIYRQRGSVAIAVRYLTSHIPRLEQLGVPQQLKDLIMLPRGLVLVAGSTGSGKSTALASMIDHRNHHRAGHILTIEEPIEFLHRHDKCIVDQREVGLDTLSYESALKNALREAPDVILIGEIRDRETMAYAIAYAEAGHLCLSTLHANNASQALHRIVNLFPDSARQQLLIDLSANLQGIVAMRLVKGLNAKRVPAVELMVRTPFIANLIEKGEIDQLKDAMKAGTDLGMQTFDESLFRLYQGGSISLAEALENADSRTDLSLRVRLGQPRVEPDAMAIEEMY